MRQTAGSSPKFSHESNDPKLGVLYYAYCRKKLLLFMKSLAHSLNHEKGNSTIADAYNNMQGVLDFKQFYNIIPVQF